MESATFAIFGHELKKATFVLAYDAHRDAGGAHALKAETRSFPITLAVGRYGHSLIQNSPIWLIITSIKRDIRNAMQG